MKVFPNSNIYCIHLAESNKLMCLGRFPAKNLTLKQYQEISRHGWCKDGHGYLLLEKAIPIEYRRDVWNDHRPIVEVIEWITESMGTYGK